MDETQTTHQAASAIAGNSQAWEGTMNPIMQAAVVAAASLVAVPAHANSYHLVDLGPGPLALAVNDSGIVLGSPTKAEHRGKYYRDGRWHPLRPAGGTINGGNGSLNASSDIVGQTFDAGTGVFTGVVWPHLGRPVAVALPPDAVGDGSPYAISNSGIIVGLYSNTRQEYRTFMTMPDGQSASLGDFYCQPYAVNDHAEVACYNNRRGYRWKNGEFQDLGTLPGGTWVYVEGMNRQGQIVGTAGTSQSPSGDAFLWSDGIMTDLGGLAGYIGLTAFAINDHGEIVGTGALQSDLSGHAMRFANGRAYLLEGEVDKLSDWKLLSASSINNEGVIVGYGKRTDLKWRSFMLIPMADSKPPRERSVD
jgi:probable HAF family extracellular repeat protein